jgi:hypothetical protein
VTLVKVPSTTPPTELPTVTFAADGCILGYWRNVSIAVWATQATIPLVNELVKLAEQLDARYAKTSTAHLIINNAQVPTPEARVALNALTDRFQSKLVCVVTLVEATGFWASTMRSFLTGLHLLGRREFKNKIAANVHEAATWLAATHSARTNDVFDAAELERVFTWMLAQPPVRGRRV